MHFWYKKNLFNYLLIPISLIWQLITYIRLKKTSINVVDPLVICIGNITVGGAGKTPFTIFLSRELQKLGLSTAILSRGYGGKLRKKVLLVNPDIHKSDLIGDEGCLLSKAAPLVIAKDRFLGARILAEKKFQIILMDDGFQNIQIKKDVNILVFNTLNPFGNGLIIPAGPLRESFNSAKKRADIVVGIGNCFNKKLSKIVISSGLKYIHAEIKAQLSNIDPTKSYLAFCSIGYPDKFYKILKSHGIDVKLTKSFKDHYFYTDKDIEKLIKEANSLSLRLITTIKDYVKINPKYYSYIDKVEIDISLRDKETNYLIKFILSKLKAKGISATLD